MKDRMIWGMLFCTGLAAGAAGVYVLSQPAAPSPAIERPVAAATVAPVVETDSPIVVAAHDPSADRKREVQAMWATTTAENLRDPMDLTRLVEVDEAPQQATPKGEVVSCFPIETLSPIPPAVETQTSGMIHDRTNSAESLVLNNGNILKVGGNVPLYPAVRITSVKRGAVTYEYQGKKDTVLIKSR